MHRSLRLLVAVSLMSPLALGCGEPETDPVDTDAGVVSGEDAGVEPDGGGADGSLPPPTARQLLEASEVPGACAAYKAELTAAPADPQAAFGAALSCALLLPDSPAVTGLLDLCGQPRFDLAHQFFGPTGLFAQERAKRQGSGTLALASSTAQTGPFSPVDFAPDLYVARIWESEHTDGSGHLVTQRTLAVKAADVFYGDTRDTARFELEAHYENAVNNGTTPLTDGLEIAAVDLNGWPHLELPEAGQQRRSYSMPVSGSIVFHKVGTGAPGDAVEIELRDLVLQGHDELGSPTAAFARISGRFVDAITEDPEPTLPFAEIDDDLGPPERPGYVVVFDLAPSLSTAYLQGRIELLLVDVEEIAGFLDVALGGASAESFSFSIPASLFHLDGAIPVNVTDLRVFKSLVDAAGAAGHLALQYELLSKPFSQLVGVYQKWVDDEFGQPVQKSFKDWLYADLVADLNATLLERQEGFDLQPVRVRLLSAIAHGRDAMLKAPQGPGITNFQAADARPFAAGMNTHLAFVRESLMSSTPQPFPNAPDYTLSVSAFFADPLDRAKLHAASTGGTGIFSVRPGDPSSSSAWDRNDDLEPEAEALQTVLEPYFGFPEDLSAQACSAAQPCPGRYRCAWTDELNEERCEVPDLLLIDQAAVDQAFPEDGEPAFLNLDAIEPFAHLD